MGCTVSRSSVSAEKYLRERESVCGPAKASVRDADITLRRYAQNWQLTPDQWSKAASHLGVSIENDAIARHRDFFRSFRREGFYAAKDLLVALVLLGQGTQQEKLELIFEAYQEKCADSLPAHTIHSMSSTLLQIAILRTTLLSRAPNKEIETEVKQYLTRFKVGMRFAASALADSLLAGRKSLSLEDFLATSQKAGIASCGGLRDFAVRASLQATKNTPKVY